MKKKLFSAILIFTLAAHGEDAKITTVIRGHHVGESFREYLAASQLHDISDCDALLADQGTEKALHKITKKTGHSFESMTTEDEIDLILRKVILPSGKSEFLAPQLDRCRDIRARLEKPLTFKEEGNLWLFVDGKLIQMDFDFGAKDYFGKPVGPDVSFDDVVSDFTTKFGEPTRGIQTFQNGFGAVFTLKTAMWKRTDVYISAEEKRPESLGLARGPSTVVKVIDRAAVEEQEREKQQRPNIVDSK